MAILSYFPDDMTVTAGADTPLAVLQAALRERGQWLPLDPPQPDRATVGDLIAQNLSGPRRYGYGTVRDHLIGLRAELADGKLIRAGGRVVKNVAGYDLCKLFVGAHGQLGAVREATFKVRPLPETEIFLAVRLPTVEAACDFAERIDTSVLTPVVLDLHNLDSQELPTWTVVIGFADDRDSVAWQRQQAGRLGVLVETNLDYERQFWAPADEMALPVRKLSVLPSKLQETLAGLEPPPSAVVARAGNGVIYYRGGPKPPARVVEPALSKLFHRVKDALHRQHHAPANAT